MRAMRRAIALALLLPAAGAFGAEIGDPSKGLAYAERNCATCHAVRPKEDHSPDPKAIPFRRVANTPGMTATALTVWFRTPHPNMPNLILPDADRLDVIAYILSLKD